MDIATPEHAHEVIANAVKRATDRYVATLSRGRDPVRFSDLLEQPMPGMVGRILRSVEESFWRRETTRRQKDLRFRYGDAALGEVQPEWDRRLRRTMVLSAKELRQLVERALMLQMEAIIFPVECMKTNYFARQETVTARNSAIIANHIGLAERYLRALTFMAQDDPNQSLTPDDFRRVVRDVDAKEHGGSQDRTALSALSQALLALGLRTEDDFGTTPSDLAEAFMLLRGTPDGLAAVRKATEGKAQIDVMELEGIFAVAGAEETARPERSTEEVQRFLEDLGLEADAATTEGEVTAPGGVRFMLTDEEKRQYVARSVGRHVHLIEPIMKAIEGALTWEEVDRVIYGIVPDAMREDVTKDFRSRIRPTI